ncbi:MAG: nucleoside-triphosphatase [archaeon]|nr:nucleoside-triphosphatase [archaeon]
MNIFLTGEIQVGKSTIINKFIKSHSDLKIGGFKTLTNFNQDQGVYMGVYIVPGCDYEPDYSEESHVGDRGNKKSGYPEKFNSKGVDILNTSGDYDLILMDEIGFMETKAENFANAVLKFLDGNVPVIGVVKPMMKGLPLAVKQHPKTKVLEVTKDNRDELYFEFEQLLEEKLTNV